MPLADAGLPAPAPGPRVSRGWGGGGAAMSLRTGSTEKAVGRETWPQRPPRIVEWPVGSGPGTRGGGRVRQDGRVLLDEEP